MKYTVRFLIAITWLCAAFNVYTWVAYAPMHITIAAPKPPDQFWTDSVYLRVPIELRVTARSKDGNIAVVDIGRKQACTVWWQDGAPSVVCDTFLPY